MDNISPEKMPNIKERQINLGTESSQTGFAENTSVYKKKKLIIAICITVIAIMTCICVYVGVAISYESKFLPNTYIQNTNVSDMTVSDATNSVMEGFNDSSVTIIENGQEDITLTGEELGLKPISGSVDDLLSQQDQWSWLSRVLGGSEELSVGVQYDSELLIDKINELECVNEETRTAPKNASIEYDENAGQFKAIEGERGDLVDKSALLAEVSNLIVNGGGVIDVEEFYAQPAYGIDSEEVLNSVSEANRIISKSITYNIDMIDNAETLTKEQIASFLNVDDEMNVIANEENIAAWLREIGKEYDTAGKSKTYTTVYGKTVDLPGGSYGWITDESEMLPIVVDNLLCSDSDIDQDFKYQQEAAGPAGNGEWGNTYIDIDITDQKVRVVQDGQLIHEFVCITGKPDGKHDSTQGEHQVVRIEKDFVMTGELDRNGIPEYTTPCSYFIAWHSNGCAMHDANWQNWNTWNNRKYKTGYGSHGCANMRPQDASVIYDFAEMGMPVLVHE